MTAKALGVMLLALVIGVFVWDYVAVHPWGRSLAYRVETRQGSGGAVVSVGGPDTETFFNGEGYAWEIRPISISGSQAVVDFRVKHFNYFAPASDMRLQLKDSEFRRLTLRHKQPLSIEAPDGARVSISGSIY